MSNAKASSQAEESPKLVLRTYQASDYNYVDYLYYSTYFALVPEGVRRKLWSPLTWAIWFGVYSYLLLIVPVLLSGMNVPSWAPLALKVFFTFAWAAVWFAALFAATDRFEIVDKVECARQNDLSDPEVYYLNWIKREVIVDDEESEQEKSNSKKRVTFDKDAKPAVEVVRERKPESEQTPSHFWVLAMEGTPCAMLGLACNREDIEDKRETLPAPWKRLGAAIFRRYHLTVPNIFKASPTAKRDIFAKAHEPNTATLQRLAVKYEFQSCGLSTLLINRAINWAADHGIERVYATTDEMMMQAENVLQLRHGFKKVEKKRTGWFGQYEATWYCDVQEWKEKNNDKTKPQFKKVSS
ncbi:hypothetical protein DFQ28_003695 [Apophysomyces sp. BC1034]|nr:hypothetical protein DFQ30_003695 [Apophysomyces sp. BC1015]KAG0179039.1 hypothetical protein DFQ29_002686 [Apophysomyces sp. BC1021]KAG0189231.1 hypothetical protein DFQ28_003695 [Apophysomyces sp. BC1034]